MEGRERVYVMILPNHSLLSTHIFFLVDLTRLIVLLELHSAFLSKLLTYYPLFSDWSSQQQQHQPLLWREHSRTTGK